MCLWVDRWVTLSHTHVYSNYYFFLTPELDIGLHLLKSLAHQLSAKPPTVSILLRNPLEMTTGKSLTLALILFPSTDWECHPQLQNGISAERNNLNCSSDGRHSHLSWFQGYISQLVLPRESSQKHYVTVDAESFCVFFVLILQSKIIEVEGPLNGSWGVFLLLVATSDWHELFFRCRTVLPVLVLTFSFVCLLPTCFFLLSVLMWLCISGCMPKNII